MQKITHTSHSLWSNYLQRDIVQLIRKTLVEMYILCYYPHVVSLLKVRKMTRDLYVTENYVCTYISFIWTFS